MLSGFKPAEESKIIDLAAVAPDPDLMSSQHSKNSIALEHARDVLRKNSNDFGSVRRSKVAASTDHRLQPIIEDESLEQSKLISNDLDAEAAKASGPS